MSLFVVGGGLNNIHIKYPLAAHFKVGANNSNLLPTTP